MELIDAAKNYLLLQYTIYEGDNDKTEKAFFDLMKEIKEGSERGRLSGT